VSTRLLIRPPDETLGRDAVSLSAARDRAVLAAAGVAREIVARAAEQASARFGTPVTPPRVDVEQWIDGASDREVAVGRLLLRASLEAERMLTGPPPPPLIKPGPPRRVESSELLVAPVPPAPPVSPPIEFLPAVEDGVPLAAHHEEPWAQMEATHLARQQRTVTTATWVRNIGAILVLFIAYQLWGTRFEQARAQARLKAGFAAATRAPSPDASKPAPVALPGGAVAHLQIPTIGVDQYVVEGTGTDDLRKGPGHYKGSPLPGQAGNAAIAGHRPTYGAPFNRLDELKIGDRIVTSTPAGPAVYVVSQPPFAVSPHRVDVVNDFGDDRLTLTTCNPKFSATQRLIVVARPEHPQPSAPRPKKTATVGQADTNQWRFGVLPLVLLWTLALVGIARLHRPLRERWPGVLTYVLLVPLWACGLLLLFEQLNRFLPPNV